MARSFHHSPSSAWRGCRREERCCHGDREAETGQAATRQGEYCASSPFPSSQLLRGVWMQDLLPHPPTSWEQAPLPGSISHVLHMSCSRLFPAAFDLGLDAPRHITGHLSRSAGAPPEAPGVRSLLEPTMLLLLWNHPHPCHHHTFPLCSLGTSLPASHLSLTRSGKVPPGQGLCPAVCAMVPPAPPWSPRRGWSCGSGCLPCHAREQPVPT